MCMYATTACGHSSTMCTHMHDTKDMFAELDSRSLKIPDIDPTTELEVYDPT